MEYVSMEKTVENLLTEMGFAWSYDDACYLNGEVEVDYTGSLYVTLKHNGEFKMTILPTKFNVPQVKLALQGFLALQ